MEQPVSRRKAFAMIAAALAGSAVVLAATSVEAKPKWGRPPGWSRGRKRGWAKRGGPKWRW